MDLAGENHCKGLKQKCKIRITVLMEISMNNSLI